MNVELSEGEARLLIDACYAREARILGSGRPYPLRKSEVRELDALRELRHRLQRMVGDPRLGAESESDEKPFNRTSVVLKGEWKRFIGLLERV